MIELVFIIVLYVSAVAGYNAVARAPKSAFLPLISGSNAISGVTVLGAVACARAAVSTGNRILAGLAVVLATINVVGGFVVTHRILAAPEPEPELNKRSTD